MVSRAEWKKLLRQLLLEAGVDGIKQSKITHSLLHRATSEEITQVLTIWQEVGAVQKFRISGKAHRPYTVWRATTKLLEVEG